MQKKYIGLFGGIIVLGLGIILAIGIYKKETNLSEEVTRYQWIEMLCEHSGMIEYESKESYFPDVNEFDEYFSYVQSACEWDLIERSIKFRGEDIATGEFVAITAMKSMGESKLKTLFDSNISLSDDELISLAVKRDIITRSNLKKGVTVKKCIDILEKIDALNYGNVFNESITEIRVKEGIVEILDSDIEEHNADYSEVTISNEMVVNLTKNNAVVLEDENGIKFIKKIVDIRKDKLILGNGVNIDDVLEELVSYETHEIEFKDIAQFYRFDNNVEAISSVATNRRYNVAHLNSQMKNNKGFKLGICSEENEQIEISITDNATEERFILPMPEDIKLGASFNAEVDVQKIICTPYIDYNAIDGVRYAEVALDVEANMSGELDVPMPEIEPIPLFAFTIPLANGFAQVDIQIYMQIEADGSISFSAKVPIQSCVCYEKGNGVRRINREVEFEEPTINANCSLEAGVNFQPILTILKCLEVMEAQLSVGLTGEANAVTHINEQTCVDVESAYPIVAISIGADEDRKNVLTILGLSKEWEIVSADNAPFQFHMHWEAFEDGKEQFVDECTYKEDMRNEKEDIKDDKGEIELNNTYCTKLGEVFQVTIPKYTFNYPDNWKIEEETYMEESLTLIAEKVILSNGKGAHIAYIELGDHEKKNWGGGSRMMEEQEVTKVSDSSLKLPPSFIEEESDFPDYGEFMVAEIHTIGSIDYESGEFIETDGGSTYAVIPASYEGTYIKTSMGNYLNNYVWYYGGYRIFVAYGIISDDDLEEVIAILESFRLAESEDEFEGF